MHSQWIYFRNFLTPEMKSQGKGNKFTSLCVSLCLESHLCWPLIGQFQSDDLVSLPLTQTSAMKYL